MAASTRMRSNSTKPATYTAAGTGQPKTPSAPTASIMANQRRDTHPQPRRTTELVFGFTSAQSSVPGDKKVLLAPRNLKTASRLSAIVGDSGGAFQGTVFFGGRQADKRDPERLRLFAEHLDPGEVVLFVLPCRSSTLLLTVRRLVDLRPQLASHGAWNVLSFS